jgi:hypothetical protein
MSVNSSFNLPSSQSLHPMPPRVAVLIPAYEPTSSLVDLVDRLTEAEAPAIVVVDDCSSSTHQWALEEIALNPAVHVLRHCRSQGKGLALKTGMRYYLDYLSHYTGLVTARAEGQHTGEDIVRVARALHKAPGVAILGARSFDHLRARDSHSGIRRGALLGNRMLVFLFRALTGIPVSDAQTGLRGLPTALLPSLLALPGNRYEYEMAVLLHIARSGHPLAEQPIGMLRGAGNSDSDFRPFADSWRVFRALLNTYQAPVFTPDVAAVDSGMKIEGAKWPGTLHVK